MWDLGIEHQSFDTFSHSAIVEDHFNKTRTFQSRSIRILEMLGRRNEI